MRKYATNNAARIHFCDKDIFPKTTILIHHGIEALRQCRGLEKDIIRYEKLCQDLQFLLICKKEGLVPIFAKPKLSITADQKLRKQIASLLIKIELKNKHRIKLQIKVKY